MTDLWVMELDTVPDTVFERSRVQTREAERNALRGQSRQLFAVGAGRELMFILGVLPPTMLSREAYFWMLFLEGVEVTRGQVRLLRKIFRAALRQFPWIMRAEVYEADDRGEKFARFLGAKFIEQRGNRLVYGWN